MEIQNCIDTAVDADGETIKLAYKLIIKDDDLYSYSLEEIETVIGYFLIKYARIFKVPHPDISLRAYKTLIKEMPYIMDDYQENVIELTPDDYEFLIDCYFTTALECNYNIIHFFSGNIRLMRYYDCFG